MSQIHQSGRFQAVDALRGIAALGVVIFHFSLEFSRHYEFTSWVPPEWIEALRYGPHFFYMISGFVIFMTLDRATSGSSFMISRLIRLMPAFWAALLLTSLVTHFWGPELLGFSWVDVLINAFFLQGILEREHVDGAYWSLLVEMAFYILAAAVVFAFKWRSKIQIMLWVWFIVPITLMQYVEHFPYPSEILLTELLISGYCVYFIVGIIMYLGHQAGRTPWNLKMLMVLSIIFISLVNPPPYGFFISAAIGVLWMAIKGKLDWLLLYKPLLWMGALSYPLYLIHQNIGITLMTTLINSGYSDAISFTAAFALSIVLAQMIFSFVEKPARAWLSKRYLKK